MFITNRIYRQLLIYGSWHLNNLKAGTVKQQAFIDEWEKNNSYDIRQYVNIKEAELEDNGYKYGHSWLVNPLPEEIIKNYRYI